MKGRKFERLFESDEEIAEYEENIAAENPEIEGEELPAPNSEIKFDTDDTTNNAATISPAPDDEPSPISNPKRNVKRFMLWVIAILILGVGIWSYFNYFNAYIIDAQKIGYISSVEKRGVIFKTYEGKLTEEYTNQNGTQIIPKDFEFTFSDSELAEKAMNLQGTGKRIKVRYRKYNDTLPWRGDSEYVVFDIQSD